MKHLVLLLICTFLSTSMFAQEEKPMYDKVTVVFSQNKCHGEHTGALDEMSMAMAPIMEEVVDAGHWVNWGILEHSWGDEWNYNYFYSAPDRDAFFKGWDMFVARVSEEMPDAFAKWQTYCFEHKDNIYTQRIGHRIMPKKEKAE